MRQTACLAVNPIIVDGYGSLFSCTTAVRASDLMTASGLWLDSMSLVWPDLVQLLVFSHEYSSLFIIVINLIFIFFHFDASTELGAFM